MSSDTTDMIAKLMMAQQQTPQPSFAGIAAPNQNNAAIQAVQQYLQQQQFLNQNTQPTGGQYGYLHDAGKAAMISAGQQVGGMLPDSAPQAPPQSSAGAAMKQAIMAAQQQYSQDLQKGVQPQQAKINALTLMANAGVPGVDVPLEAAQKDLETSKKTTAETFKDTQQGNASQDEITNRALQRELDQKKFDQATQENTYKVDQTTATRQILVNGLGKKISVELNAASNAPPSAQQMSGEDTLAKMIASGAAPMLTGKQALTPAGLRINAAAVAQNPSLSTADNASLVKAGKEYTPGGTEGKSLTAFNTALNHGDELSSLVNNLNNSDSQIANKAKNAFAQQFGGTGPTNMKLAAQLYAGELEKTILSTGGTKDERDDLVKVFSNVNTPAQLNDAIKTANNLLVGKVRVSRQNFERYFPGQDFEGKFLSPTAKRLTAADPNYTQQFPATSPDAPAAAPKIVDFSSL